MNKPTAAQLKDPQWWGVWASEDATHYSEYYGAFVKPFDSDQWVVLRQGPKPIVTFMDTGMLFERPNSSPEDAQPAAPEWEGLVPAVGDKCDAVWLEDPDGGSRDYEPVLIKGYFKAETMKVWFSTRNGEDIVRRMEHCNFRPLLTKEQRNRDDLARALLDDMDALDIYMPGDTARAIAISIMNRGWIRVEK
jgi:hypothetical protein